MGIDRVELESVASASQDAQATSIAVSSPSVEGARRRATEYYQRHKGEPEFEARRRKAVRDWRGRHKDDPEYKIKQKASQRRCYERWRMDPSYLDKSQRMSKERWKTIKADPELYKKHLEWEHDQYRKEMANPVTRARINERARNYHRMRMQDPEYREKKRDARNRANAKRRNDAAYKAKTRVWTNRTRVRLRERIFAIYGQKCACCGESNLRFLTLDHVKNDGAEHRRSYGGYIKGTYVEAIKFPDPSRFQVLCWNCNMGKMHNHGICPHKKHNGGAK